MLESLSPHTSPSPRARPRLVPHDGSALSDADWKTQHKVIGQTPGMGGPQAILSDYAVNIDGQWIDVPPDAVITEPNKVGHTMVWPIKGYLGITIRCFMPGSMI